MKATSIKEAWAMADEIFPTDYMKDEEASRNAGYPIYRSTLDATCTDSLQPWYCQIADLGCRLEVTVTRSNWDQKVINIWIEAPAPAPAPEAEAPAEEDECGMTEERKALAQRLAKATFAYTREYLDELAKKAEEDAAVKALQEASDQDGVVRCMVLTAEQNAKVMLDCIKEMRRAVDILQDENEDVDPWMIAGITAMLDKCNAMKVIPFDLPTSICGVLGADWRK